MDPCSNSKKNVLYSFPGVIHKQTLPRDLVKFSSHFLCIIYIRLHPFPKLNSNIYYFVPDHHQHSFLLQISVVKGHCPIRKIVFYLSHYGICFKNKIITCSTFVKVRPGTSLFHIEKERQGYVHSIFHTKVKVTEKCRKIFL